MAWFEHSRDPAQQRGFELIGATIRRRRLALGWTQRDLEARSGIDQAVISRLENGKQYGMRWLRFAELVEALGGLETSADTRPWPPGARPWPPGATQLPIEDDDEPTATQIIDLALGLDPRHDGEPDPGWGSVGID
jgi:transcriptional regulator with XRE-family HTH domain